MWELGNDGNVYIRSSASLRMKKMFDIKRGFLLFLSLIGAVFAAPSVRAAVDLSSPGGLVQTVIDSLKNILEV